MWVLTVLAPRYSSPASRGMERPRAKPARTSRSRVAEHHVGRARLLADLAGEPRRERGRDHGLAAGHAAYGVDDVRAPGVLGQVAAGARLERPEDHRAVIDGRQDHDPGVQPVPDHRVDDVQTVEVGHLVVHDGDVGALSPDQVDGLAPGAGLADDLEVAALAEPADQAVPEELVVVDDDDPCEPPAGGRPSGCGRRTEDVGAGHAPRLGASRPGRPVRNVQCSRDRWNW